MTNHQLAKMLLKQPEAEIINSQVEFTVINGRRYPVTKFQMDCLIETLNEIAEVVSYKPNHDQFSGDKLVEIVKDIVSENNKAKIL